MVGGALLAGLAVYPFAPSVAPLAGGVIGIAAGTALGYGRWRVRAVAGVLAIAPLLAMTMGWASGLPAALGFVVSAAVLALGLAIGGGPRGVRGALGVGLAALVTLVGMWCALRVVHARETAHWPLWLTTAAGAAAMGMVGMLAVLPRHLAFEIDPITSALRGLPAVMDPEVRTLCDRSLAIWRTAKESLADEGGKRLVREGVLKTLEVAHKSVAVRATGATDAELAARMTELDGKIGATADTEAKTQYQAARAALDDQQRYREHIAKGRERLVARMHNHVAALEKFHLAATGLASARAASEGSAAVKQLEELSQDVAASGEALAELELGAAHASSDAIATMS